MKKLTTIIALMMCMFTQGEIETGDQLIFENIPANEKLYSNKDPFGIQLAVQNNKEITSLKDKVAQDYNTLNENINVAVESSRSNIIQTIDQKLQNQTTLLIESSTAHAIVQTNNQEQIKIAIDDVSNKLEIHDSSINGKFNSLNGKLNDDLSRIEDQINNVSSKVSLIGTNFNHQIVLVTNESSIILFDVGQQYNNIYTNFQNSIRKVDRNLNAVNDVLDSTTNKIVNVETILTNETSQLNSKIDQLTTSVGDNVQTKLDALKSNLDNSMQSLDTNIGQIQNTVQTTLVQNNVEMTEKIESMNDKIKLSRFSSSGNFSDIENVPDFLKSANAMQDLVQQKNVVDYETYFPNKIRLYYLSPSSSSYFSNIIIPDVFHQFNDNYPFFVIDWGDGSETKITQNMYENMIKQNSDDDNLVDQIRIQHSYSCPNSFYCITIYGNEIILSNDFIFKTKTTGTGDNEVKTEIKFKNGFLTGIVAVEDENITDIPDNMFSELSWTTDSASSVINASNLRHISLPNVKYVGNSSFANTRLLSLADNKFIDIGDNAFYDAKFLYRDENLSLNSAQTIGANAFYSKNAKSHEYSINLPNVVEIGTNAFKNAQTPSASGGLNFICMPNAKIIGDGAFMNQNSTSSEHEFVCSIPNATEIGTNAFANCKIKKLMLNANVKFAGNRDIKNSFNGNKIEELFIIGDSYEYNENEDLVRTFGQYDETEMKLVNGYDQVVKNKNNTLVHFFTKDDELIYKENISFIKLYREDSYDYHICPIAIYNGSDTIQLSDECLSLDLAQMISGTQFKKFKNISISFANSFNNSIVGSMFNGIQFDNCQNILIDFTFNGDAADEYMWIKNPYNFKNVNNVRKFEIKCSNICTDNSSANDTLKNFCLFYKGKNIEKIVIDAESLGNFNVSDNIYMFSKLKRCELIDMNKLTNISLPNVSKNIHLFDENAANSYLCVNMPKLETISNAKTTEYAFGREVNAYSINAPSLNFVEINNKGLINGSIKHACFGFEMIPNRNNYTINFSKTCTSLNLPNLETVELKNFIQGKVQHIYLPKINYINGSLGQNVKNANVYVNSEFYEKYIETNKNLTIYGVPKNNWIEICDNEKTSWIYQLTKPNPKKVYKFGKIYNDEDDVTDMVQFARWSAAFGHRFNPDECTSGFALLMVYLTNNSNSQHVKKIIESDKFLKWCKNNKVLVFCYENKKNSIQSNVLDEIMSIDSGDIDSRYDVFIDKNGNQVDLSNAPIIGVFADKGGCRESDFYKLRTMSKNDGEQTLKEWIQNVRCDWEYSELEEIKKVVYNLDETDVDITFPAAEPDEYVNNIVIEPKTDTFEYGVKYQNIDNFESIKKFANENNNSVLIVYGSIHCSYCDDLENLIDSENFREELKRNNMLLFYYRNKNFHVDTDIDPYLTNTLNQVIMNNPLRKEMLLAEWNYRDEEENEFFYNSQNSLKSSQQKFWPLLSVFEGKNTIEGGKLTKTWWGNYKIQNFNDRTNILDKNNEDHQQLRFNYLYKDIEKAYRNFNANRN